jgi:putative endonuclease
VWLRVTIENSCETDASEGGPCSLQESPAGLEAALLPEACRRLQGEPRVVASPDESSNRGVAIWWGASACDKQVWNEQHFLRVYYDQPLEDGFYTWVTNNLPRRVYEHEEKLTPGFASKYKVTDLVYYEMAETAEAAIAREKQLKSGSRRRKIELINSMNPSWRDLSGEL